jgi:hypothetical protein
MTIKYKMQAVLACRCGDASPKRLVNTSGLIPFLLMRVTESNVKPNRVCSRWWRNRTAAAIDGGFHAAPACCFHR